MAAYQEIEDESPTTTIVFGASMLDLLCCGLGAAALLSLIFVAPLNPPRAASEAMGLSKNVICIWLDEPERTPGVRWNLIVKSPNGETEIPLRNLPSETETLDGSCKSIGWAERGPILISEPILGEWSFSFRWADLESSQLDPKKDIPKTAILEIRIASPNGVRKEILGPVKFASRTKPEKENISAEK